MKRAVLIITLSIFGGTAVLTVPTAVVAQRKDKDDKKKPEGPPVVRDKGKGERPKEPPKKDRRPPN